ncbi:MAG: hypothetical protein AAFQ90_09970 [Pseudomonadota bacterium]
MPPMPGEPLVARYSRAKLSAYLFAAALLVSLGLGLLAHMIITSNPAVWIIGPLVSLSVLPFSAACVILLCKVFDRRVQLRVDGEGFAIRGHSAKTIHHRAIIGVKTRNGLVALQLQKAANFPIENRHRRLIWRLNGPGAEGYFGDAWVWTSQLDCTPADVLNAIHDFRPLTDWEREMRERGLSARSDLVPNRF